MKKIFTLITLTLSLTFMGCDDNAYDGENGLFSKNESVDTTEQLESIYTKIRSNAQNTYEQSLELVSLSQEVNGSVADLEALRLQLQDLIVSYKKVEAVYVAEKLDSSMTDTPVYIEAFSAGDADRKATLLEDLDNVLDPNNSVAIEDALYKNAHKSITGLVHTLYGEQESAEDIFAKMDERRSQAVAIIAAKISENIKIVHDFYQEDTQFLADSDAALEILINQLTISSNRLREWRVGDPGGLTQKYEGKADASRFEYYASLTTIESLKSIVKTHKEMMLSGLETIADAGNAASEADAVVERINTLLDTCESFAQAIELDATDEKVVSLYNDSYALQQDYTALINALNFTQDIIEADGD